LLRDRDDILAEVRQRLVQAQQLSKRYYDAGHRDMELAVGIGCGCAFYIGPCSPWSHAQKGSSALAMPDRSESWSASARWHTGWSYQREPACTTYFMWASSSATRVNRRSSVRGYPLSRMVDYYRRR
jgi:hypothetical protein